MTQSPPYEIWTARFEDDNGHHVEDCDTLEEAKKAVIEYQSHGDAAWIQDKETGKIILTSL